MVSDSKQNIQHIASDSSEEIPLASVSMHRQTPHHTQVELAKLEYRYSFLGLGVGTVALVGGMFLFLSGVVGSSNWIAKFLGAESSISDAAPGAILFVIGLFIIIATRPKVQHI